MNQTGKIFLAVIITAIMSGGSVYYWQAQKIEQDKLSTIEKTDPVSVIEKAVPATEVEQESIANNWQTYQNSEFGFKINYPKSWVYQQFDNSIGFGTPESKPGGYMWGVSVYRSSDLEKVIADVGDQFEDRKESRKEVMTNKNVVGTMVIVTTKTYPDWISKSVYFKKDGQLFQIGNGAVDDDSFDDFYKSFEFTK
jgi:hypothetical protein